MLDTELVKETQEMLGDVVGANSQVRVQVLEVVADTLGYLISQAKDDLESKTALEVFNQHGAEADPPFGAMPINGRFLLANYISSLGTEMNGVVVDKSFITREVAGWAEMEVKNNV